MSKPPGSPPLDPERWRRVREILHHALELTQERRIAYVEEACGADGGLRAEVESLIAASQQPAWIDQPLAEIDTLTLENLPAPPLADAQKVAHYQVVRKLGQGGMGAVYKAIDTNLDRPVALKFLLPDRRTLSLKERFIREAKAASALNHPNIVTIYEFGSENGLDFIAMEYVEGSTLQELLERRRAPRETLLEYARQAAGAIAKAHSAGIVHRDLKPNNIMVTGDGIVKVLDFGLAKHDPAAEQDPDTTHTLSLTIAGAIAGTPAYMSPEQVKGESVDRRTDVFSFGIILYEIACGHRPFKGPNPQATLHQIATLEPRAAADVDPTVPAKLTRLIEQCLKKDKEQRVITMAGVAQDLEDLLQGASTPVAAPRRAVIAWAAGALAVGGLGWWLTRGFPSERSLTASIIAQRMKDGAPEAESYIASPNETFEAGWRFRVQAQSQQAGYLYVVSDGPGNAGVNNLWILSKLSMAANQTAETGWNVFDSHPGTERLWIVWAGQPVDVLETAGRVDSPDLQQKIRDMLAVLKPGKGLPATSSIQLRGADSVLGGLLELRHL